MGLWLWGVLLGVSSLLVGEKVVYIPGLLLVVSLGAALLTESSKRLAAIAAVIVSVAFTLMSWIGDEEAGTCSDVNPLCPLGHLLGLAAILLVMFPSLFVLIALVRWIRHGMLPGEG